MAGGHVKYRHLSRDSAHRKALLRNLTQALFQNESISTTWPKAKEVQRRVEKIITLGKKNTNASLNAAKKHFYQPHLYLPKIFNELRHRYANRPGGYTRVLRIEPIKEDQAPSAILELVDGPKDMRFAMTARVIAKELDEGRERSAITNLNVKKVTKFRENGEEELEALAQKLKELNTDNEPLQKRVYPDPVNDRRPKKARWTKN